MKKFNLPLTYEPKIQPVIDGVCRQTIRVGNKFNVGDLVSFHGWEGKPYRSHWSFRTPYVPLIRVINGTLFHWGISINNAKSPVLWDSWQARYLAEEDGIVPATGEALREVFMSKNKILNEGIEIQIIRW